MRGYSGRYRLVCARTFVGMPGSAHWLFRCPRGWLALTLAVAGCAPTRGMVNRVSHAHPAVVFSVATCDSLVALTLDDGPSPAHTPAVLDVLAAHGARATFFVVGRRVAAHPDLARRALAEGHELANHGWSLAAPVWLGAGRAAAGWRRTADTLAALGARPRWYRPGAGVYTPAIRAAAEADGLRLALGSVYPNDPWTPSTPVLARRVLRAVRPGDVIVLHDGLGRRTRAAAVLARVLPELRRRGYRVVTLSGLVDAARPCVADSPGRGR